MKKGPTVKLAPQIHPKAEVLTDPPGVVANKTLLPEQGVVFF